jgi:methionyl-tRNA formyltransferase
MTSSLQVVFFGTPEFAVPSLAALLEAGLAVPLIVTQPDRPAGRHAAVRPSAVATLAAARGIPTEKPERVRGDAGLLHRLQEARPDAIAVVAYGHILPPEILRLPRLSCVNVHASLLPKYRGASPVQAAILAGDSATGVVTMKIEEGLDTGPLYLERRTAIGEKETAGELSARLSALGAELLVETVRGMAAGGLAAHPQEGEPSFCRPIRREDGEVDWRMPATVLSRRLRAYTPWPGLHTFLGSERVKILAAETASAGSSEAPGTLRLEAGQLIAAAGEGSALRLVRLQRAGRKPVSGAEFGRALQFPGRFGTAPP